MLEAGPTPRRHMEEELNAVSSLAERHRQVGAALYQACEGNLFPCDGLAMAVLDRSLNLLEGFVLLLKNNGYICAVPLLRMQLDNILRFHGIIQQRDPHGLAEKVFSGTRLSKMKDDDRKSLTDARLLELLEGRNPDIREIYKQASGYIHLSEQHVYHFMSRSKLDESGRRMFAIGNNDEHLSPEHKTRLVNAFETVTKGVLEVLSLWTSMRGNFGDFDSLHARFAGPT